MAVPSPAVKGVGRYRFQECSSVNVAVHIFWANEWLGMAWYTYHLRWFGEQLSSKTPATSRDRGTYAVEPLGCRHYARACPAEPRPTPVGFLGESLITCHSVGTSRTRNYFCYEHSEEVIFEGTPLLTADLTGRYFRSAGANMFEQAIERVHRLLFMLHIINSSHSRIL